MYKRQLAPVVNLSLKFDANIFIDGRYIAILLFRRFGCEVPIPAHFGKFFLGFDPLNVVGYFRDPHKHILGRKHALWRIDRSDRSRNATWARAKEESKKRKKKNSEI